MKIEFYVCLLGLLTSIVCKFSGDYELLVRSISCGCWGFMFSIYAYDYVNDLGD